MRGDLLVNFPQYDGCTLFDASQYYKYIKYINIASASWTTDSYWCYMEGFYNFQCITQMPLYDITVISKKE